MERILRVLKRQFGHTQVCYEGLAKDAARVSTLIGLTNLYLTRRRLMA
jgi:transposase, IS5 family